MEHPHEPINAINDWQIWYRNNKIVAELNEPLVTKDSREKLHDSSNAVSSVYAVPDWKTFWEKPYESNNVYKQKAAEHFADTIAEFQNELTGAELFEAFTAAAMQHLEFIEKEYNNAKQLSELIQGNVKN